MRTLKRKQKLAMSIQHSYLTLFIKIAGLLLTILTIIVTVGLLYDSMKRPNLEVELLLEYDGFKIRVLNNGNALASQIHVDVVSWGNGAPAASIKIKKEIRDLPPNTDFIFDIDLLNHGGKVVYPSGSHRCSSSGYIVVYCNNCDKPRAWAFYTPEETEYFNFITTYLSGHSWPIVEFDYPEDKPGIGRYVNYPKEFSKELPPISCWYPKKK